jgi:hypothetical protein
MWNINETGNNKAGNIRGVLQKSNGPKNLAGQRWEGCKYAGMNGIDSVGGPSFLRSCISHPKIAHTYFPHISSMTFTIHVKR